MKITILGTGALGIALAKTIYENNKIEITMWTKFDEEARLVSQTRKNEKLLPNIVLPQEIEVTSNLELAVKNSEIIINCLPFIAVKESAKLLKSIYNNQYICSTTKGIDLDTFETTTQIFKDELNTDRICALSGPSFAIEIATNKPISFVLAGKDEKTIGTIYDVLKTDNITIKKSSDDIGVQLCGAIKNAVAIGSGILYGMNAADSTKAAYLTRGINDIATVISCLGGSEESVFTYAGIGDLILTCTSEKSRNFSCGKLLGEGYTLEEAIIKLNGKTVEGIKAIDSLHNYMIKNNINLDTIPKLYDIIFNKENINIIEK